MVNYSAKILNNAVSGLSAQQALLAAIGNNIANVNTEGYARRTVELQTRVSSSQGQQFSVGSGVQVGPIRRLTDVFLERLVRQSAGTQQANSVQADVMERVQSLFNLTGDGSTIGSALTAFFTATNDLTTNPSSIELRSNVISKVQDLVTAVRSTYEQIARLQTEADQRIAREVDSVNAISAQIAELNGLISSVEANGTTAADERDRRDVLVRQLGEKVSFDAVEQNDGSVQLTLDNGFTLVSGVTARALSVTASPSFATGPLPPSLEGGTLSYITYDYDAGAGTEHLDLTEVIGAGEGSLGGLLAVRGYADPTNTSAFEATGTLVQAASRIESIARALLTSVNSTYLGPDRDSGTVGHQASSGDLDGNAPSVFGLFDFEFSGIKDADGDGLPSAADLNDPTIGIDSFASRLTVAFSDPRRLAAALDASGGPPNPALFNPGDGSNMEALAALQFDDTTSFSIGSYSLTGSFDEAYNETVVYVGSQASRATQNTAVAQDQLATALNRRDQVSGVSLDEEFTRLITGQRAFEASARMIRVADELLQVIVGLI